MCLKNGNKIKLTRCGGFWIQDESLASHSSSSDKDEEEASAIPFKSEDKTSVSDMDQKSTSDALESVVKNNETPNEENQKSKSTESGIPIKADEISETKPKDPGLIRENTKSINDVGQFFSDISRKQTKSFGTF